jgi:hypothetical protein
MSFDTPLPRRRRFPWLAPAVLVAMGLATAGQARDAGGREAALFEHPARVQTVKAKSADDPTGEITCTTYADLMIRETGTDTPDPGAASLVRIAAGAKRPVCGRTPPPGSAPLKTEGQSLLGRKGGFLVFGDTDPNGAVSFQVLAASNGRRIFTDAKTDNGFTAVGLKDGALHLVYRRGFNASCSLVKNAASCWVSLVRQGAIPPEMAKSPPAAKACAAAYAKDQPRPAPADDPSIVTYALDITLDASGKVKVNSHGAAACEPMP